MVEAVNNPDNYIILTNFFAIFTSFKLAIVYFFPLFDFIPSFSVINC